MKKAKKAPKPKKKAAAKKPAAKKPIEKKIEPQVFQLNEKRRVLHVGCGSKVGGSRLHKSFDRTVWDEVRLDIVPEVEPDIVADMRNMNMVKEGEFDALFSSHNIEHVFPHDVLPTLKEFHRVIKTDGYVLLTCPNLENVMKDALKKGLENPLYNSPAGPISALDIFYGHRASIARGEIFMAHKTGFTDSTLANYFAQAGFLDIKLAQDGYDLWVQAFKRSQRTKENSVIRFNGREDVNKMMRARDEIDQEPKIWKGLPKELKS